MFYLKINKLTRPDGQKVCLDKNIFTGGLFGRIVFGKPEKGFIYGHV